MDDHVAEAIDKYYRLKMSYETTKNKKYSTSNKNKKKRKETARKPPCVECKREVGTIFTRDKSKLIAHCGDQVNPCAFKLTIEKGSYYPFKTHAQGNHTIQGVLETIKIVKTKIMELKMHLLFKVKTEDEIVEEFDKLNKELNEEQEHYLARLQMVEELQESSSADTNDTLRTLFDDRSTLLKEMAALEEEFKKSKHHKFLTEYNSIYCGKLMPLISQIQKEQYRHMNVEVDEETNIHHLRQCTELLQYTEQDNGEDPMVIDDIGGRDTTQKKTNKKDDLQNADADAADDDAADAADAADADADADEDTNVSS